MTTYHIAYLFIRLSMGISMFTHGLVRIPKLEEFKSGMVEQFSESMLPSIVVASWGYATPIIELILGVLLIIGLLTRISAISGGIFMLILLFGSGMVENWGAFPSQLLHIAFFAVLLIYLPYNSLSLDKKFTHSLS